MWSFKVGELTVKDWFFNILICVAFCLFLMAGSCAGEFIYEFAMCLP